MSAKFYGINHIKSFYKDEKEDRMLIEMNVQSDKRKTAEDIILILDMEDVIDLVELLISQNGDEVLSRILELTDYE